MEPTKDTANEPVNVSLMDEIITDLEKKYKKPDPETIAIESSQLENLAMVNFFPLVGAIAFLYSSLTLSGITKGYPYFISFINLLIASVLSYWVFIKNRENINNYPWIIGTTLALIVIPVLSIQNIIITTLFCLAYSITLAYLLYKNKLQEKSSVLLVLFYPLSLFELQPNIDDIRVIFIGMLLVPFFFVSQKLDFNKTFYATLLSSIVIVIYEYNKRGSGDAGLIILVAVFLLFAIIAEWRAVRRKKYVELKETPVTKKLPVGPAISFIKQSGVSILIFMLIHTIAADILDEYVVLIWAVILTIYQLIQLYRPEKKGLGSRAVWIAISWFFAIGIAFELTSPQTTMLFILIAVVLHLIGLRWRNRFPLEIGLLMVTGICVVGIFIEIDEPSLYQTLATLLSIVYILIFISEKDDIPHVKWFSGLIPSRVSTVVRKVFLVLIGGLLRIPFIAFIFSWIRTTYIWLKHLKGKDNPFSYKDLLFFIANLSGVIVFSSELSVYAKETYMIDESATYVISALVWVIWGTSLSMIGIKQKELYWRILGVLILSVPVIFELLAADVTGSYEFNLLVVLSSIALLFITLMYRGSDIETKKLEKNGHRKLTS